MRFFKNVLCCFLAIMGSACYGQIDFTANDAVPEYSEGFRFGTNMGGPQGEWDDLKLAAISAGDETRGIPGAGCNSLRLSLPNHFLESWGYEIRVNTFKSYENQLGMSELTVFLGGPSTENLDKTTYCSGGSHSKMFKNMYEPIWDNGANGTPVNENNVLAIYVYKTAMAYGDKVRFWEIWNEPDYTSSDKGWQEATSEDNWWIRDPAPCEMNNLLAPVQHYIRALRIAYEVIKFVDPEDFICVGGIGYESFLDALLRNSDNPDGGKITSAYPLKGGAYFDCLSYHNYPMYGVREYKDGKWQPLRHSDKAVEVFIDGKNKKEQVLADHGYDGGTFPKKRVIVTETNVPRRPFNDYMGSEKAQYNYLSKIIIKGQKEGIDQIHTYNLTDSKNANGPYDVMGFYPYLGETKAFEQVEHKSAIATRNTMEMLEGYSYSKFRTSGLALPSTVDGAAFSKNGKYIYALWAKTSVDNSEAANASYSFPEQWEVSSYKRYDWNYTLTGESKMGNGKTVNLTASPSFFILDSEFVLGLNKEEEDEAVAIYPNPSAGNFTILFRNSKQIFKNAQIFNNQGKQVYTFEIAPNAQNQQFSLALPSGLYILKASNGLNSISRKIIVE